MKPYSGTRSAFTYALLEMAKDNPDIMFISSDSLKAMRAVPFAQQYPERYVETGISEQCAVDVAAGLASTGLMPFVGTYAGFLTMRACEQMRTFVAYPNLNVKFIGLNGGLLGGEREGVTHQFYEDVAILSAIPNFTILTPADPQQTYEAVKYAATIPGPVYIRAASGREEDFYPENTPFSPDGCRVVTSYGEKTLILSSGFILGKAVKAAEALHEKGIETTVVDVNIIGHKNPERLVSLIKNAERAVTIEDHSVHGGLGAYIAELVCASNPMPMERLGLKDTFGESGKAQELLDKYGISAEKLIETVEKML